MKSSNAAPRGRFARTAHNFTVEVFDGGGSDATGWPCMSASPEFRMHVFQAWEFLNVWMATIGRACGAECYLVVVKDRKERPVLFLPLAVETKYNVRLLRFMDAGVADYNAPILVAGCELAREEFLAVWTEILSLLPKVDAIDLKKISGHISGTVNPLSYLTCTPYRSSGHAICLSRLRDEIYKRPSIHRMRSKVGRHFRRLNRVTPTQFVVNPPAPQADQIFRSLVALKREQYLRTDGRDFLASPGVFDFYRQMAMPHRIGRITHLSAIICEGNVMSGHLGFMGRGQVGYIMPAFDTKYRSYAAGHMLLHHLIERCSEENFATFDLGEGDFAYKTSWASHRLPLWSHEQALTAAGLAFLQMRRVRRFVSIGRFYDWRARRRLGGSAEHQDGNAPEQPQETASEPGKTLPIALAIRKYAGDGQRKVDMDTQ